MRFAFMLALSLLSANLAVGADASPAGPSTPNAPPIRAGIIGLDTSHAIVFTQYFNDAKTNGHGTGVKIVAGFPGGSPDIDSSSSRVAKYTEQVRAMGVEIVGSIPELLAKVDVVLLESVDGRPHLEQARPVFAAGKPLFIDKPLAGSLVDVLAIVDLGEKTKTPWFSSSSLRFGPTIQKLIHDPKVGAVIGCDAWSPASLEKTHPDLFWYGIHGVELLYTAMGAGCQTVARAHTEDTDTVTGVWKDGRLGVFRGTRQGPHDYGAVIFGSKSIATAIGFEGYAPAIEQVAAFFKTRKPPIALEETVEIYTFMEAADESKRLGGVPVKLETVLAKARAASRPMAN
jgi:predicted dehydrogenase